ncbi:hypothetical protein [Jannaschia sp. LMIT008]|uniref:hypothetical protein n=1 Tax=Jannaschia maritima TaxID=3032585 RepID=UPI0028113082|nr:hypothetical protein [Jannaschia sp. LMIT008]
MTRPSVTMIEGLHLTAADKSNILGCIEFMRYAAKRGGWMGRRRSIKRYALAPMGSDPARYRVIIGETYRTDAGQRRIRQSRFLIEVRGVDPLPPGDWSDGQRDLFTEAGA